jgi:hypothetical protein
MSLVVKAESAYKWPHVSVDLKDLHLAGEL